jgi:hypothetical protein
MVSFNQSADQVMTLDNRWLTTWEATSGKRLRSVEGPGYSLMDPAPVFSADGKLALTYEHAGIRPYGIAMLVWDVARGIKTRLSMGDLPKTYVNAHQHIVPLFSADGRFLAALQPGSENKAVIRFWDVRTGQETRQVPETKAGWSRQMSLLADGKTLVVAGSQAVGIDMASGREVFAWKGPVKIRTDRSIKTPDSDDGRPWKSFAISPDGRTAAYILFTGYSQKPDPDRIVLCDGKTGRLRRRLNDSGIPINGFEKLAFSTDSRTLATTDGKVVHLWEVATGAKLRTLDGHRGEVRALAFSQDGRLLATASSDSTVLVWDLTGRLQRGKLQPIHLSPMELEGRWRDLADNDAVKADRAIWELAASGDQAVAFLKHRIHAVPQPDPNHIARLTSDLDSVQFADRQAAYAELKKLGVLAEAALSKTLQANPSLELRLRIESLLQTINQPISSAEILQSIRAIPVLEAVRTPVARRLLHSLAQGAPAAHVTREARAALDRLVLSDEK